MSIEEEAKIVDQNLGRFIKNGIVPIGVAQKLVRDSAWWHGHPRGPTRAPSHFERVTSGDHGWEVQFGANSFLVEEALRRCIAHLQKAKDNALKLGWRSEERELRELMSNSVRGAVANFEGVEYDGHYQMVDGFMLFGNQAIRVVDFVDTLCTISEIHRIC